MSIESLIESFDNLSINNPEIKDMDLHTVEALLMAVIREATENTRREFQSSVDDLTRRLRALEMPPVVEQYKPMQIVENVECNETLDLAKSVPEFRGEISTYVSWRQAAITAHKLYEGYIGSSKYYQAVAILRNKVVGKADYILSSYNTVLNFYAILERLDFAYADKRSVFTLEEDLRTLVQGSKSVSDFYNEVEDKLNLIINKTLMTHGNNANLVQSLSEKYRQDALHVFVSGLNKPFCDILFSCKPSDMPTALALAQELATSRNRSHFCRNVGEDLQRGAVGNYPKQSLNQSVPRYSFACTQFLDNPAKLGTRSVQNPNYLSSHIVRNGASKRKLTDFQVPSTDKNHDFREQALDKDAKIRPADTDQHNSQSRIGFTASNLVDDGVTDVFHQEEALLPFVGNCSEHFEEETVNFLGEGLSCPGSRGNSEKSF